MDLAILFRRIPAGRTSRIGIGLRRTTCRHMACAQCYLPPVLLPMLGGASGSVNKIREFLNGPARAPRPELTGNPVAGAAFHNRQGHRWLSKR